MLANRSAAGRELARAVQAHFMPPMTIVAIVPGGIPIAAQISAKLGLPLDVAIVREEALGLFIEGFPAELDTPGASPHDVARIEEEVVQEALRLRGRRPPRYLWGQTVLLVDDGTSSSRVLDAAIRLVRARLAASIVLAVPTPTDELLDDIGGLVDDIIYVEQRAATGVAYRDNDVPTEGDLLVQLTRGTLARLAPTSAHEAPKGR